MTRLNSSRYRFRYGDGRYLHWRRASRWLHFRDDPFGNRRWTMAERQEALNWLRQFIQRCESAKEQPDGLMKEIYGNLFSGEFTVADDENRLKSFIFEIIREHNEIVLLCPCTKGDTSCSFIEPASPAATLVGSKGDFLATLSNGLRLWFHDGVLYCIDADDDTVRWTPEKEVSLRSQLANAIVYGREFEGADSILEFVDANPDLFSGSDVHDDLKTIYLVASDCLRRGLNIPAVDWDTETT